MSAPTRRAVAVRPALQPRPPVGGRARRRTDRFVASVSVRRVGLPQRPPPTAFRPRTTRPGAGRSLWGAEAWAGFGPRLALTLRRYLRRRHEQAAGLARRRWPAVGQRADAADLTQLLDAEEAVTWLPEEPGLPPWSVEASDDGSAPFAAVDALPGDRRGNRPVAGPVDLALSIPRTGDRAAAPRPPDRPVRGRTAPLVSQTATWRPPALAAIERTPTPAARSLLGPGAGAGATARHRSTAASSSIHEPGGVAGPAWPASRLHRPDLLLRAWTGTPRTEAERPVRPAVGSASQPAVPGALPNWVAPAGVPGAPASAAAAPERLPPMASAGRQPATLEATSAPPEAPSARPDPLALAGRRPDDRSPAPFDPVRAASFGARLPTLRPWLAAAASSSPGDGPTAAGRAPAATWWLLPAVAGGWIPLSTPLVRRRALARGTVAGIETVGPAGLPGWPVPSTAAVLAEPSGARSVSRVWQPPVLVAGGAGAGTGGQPVRLDELDVGHAQPTGTSDATTGRPGRWSGTRESVRSMPAGGVARWKAPAGERWAGIGGGGWPGVLRFAASAWTTGAQPSDPSHAWPAGGWPAAGAPWWAPDLALWGGARRVARTPAGAPAASWGWWGVPFPPSGATTSVGGAQSAAVGELPSPATGLASRTTPSMLARADQIRRAVDPLLVARLAAPADRTRAAAESSAWRPRPATGASDFWTAVTATMDEGLSSPPLAWRAGNSTAGWLASAPDAPLARRDGRRDPVPAATPGLAGSPAGIASPPVTFPPVTLPPVGPSTGWPVGPWTSSPGVLARTASRRSTPAGGAVAFPGIGGTSAGAAPVGGEAGRPGRAVFAGSPDSASSAPSPGWTSSLGRLPRSTAPSLVLYRSALPHGPEPSPARVLGAAASLAGSIGRPLPPAVRRTMEGAMGVDLGLVRVHSGPQVTRAAEAVGARAMTMGADVFLPGGVEDTPRPANLPLVAHELAHAVAHRADGGGAGGASTPWVRLARKEAPEEQQASSVEAFFMGSGHQAARPGIEPVDLTLARTPSPQAAGGPALTTVPAASTWSTSVVQRSPDDQPAASSASQGIFAGGLGGSLAATTGAVGRIQRVEGDEGGGAASGGGAGGNAADESALAERVFKLLQRRLIVERERIGAVGRFGRFG